MPMLVDQEGRKVESLEKQLERVDKDIEAVKRRKLVTIVSRGGPDKVIFVEPLDLRGKDPEECIEIVEEYVIETKWDNGFAQHITGKRSTGQVSKRGPVGPFGPTYKIDSGNQNGERELQEFKRVVETHTSRLSQVPEPVPYHKDVNSEGHLDLRNITLSKEDVPVAVLENYEPLNKLLKQRDVLVEKIKAGERAQAVGLKCDSCDYVASDDRSLKIHATKSHGGK